MGLFGNDIAAEFPRQVRRRKTENCPSKRRMAGVAPLPAGDGRGGRSKKVGGWTTVECLMADAGGVEVSPTRCSRGLPLSGSDGRLVNSLAST